MPRITQATKDRQTIKNHEIVHASTSGLLFAKHDVPDWLCEWVDWARQFLCPDWSIHMEVVDNPGNHPNCAAETEIVYGYLDGHIQFSRSMENNIQGQLTAIHEVCHVFLREWLLLLKVSPKLVLDFLTIYQNVWSIITVQEFQMK